MDANLLNWLLEPEDIGVRYLTLRDILHVPEDDLELQTVAREAHTSGPIQTVLAAMQPEGYWEKPGPGYGPKYKSTVWAVNLLAQLGGHILYDDRIEIACNYVLSNGLTTDGKFSYNQKPYGTFDCLQGNLVWALLELGCNDERLTAAIDWLARSQTGEGVAPAEEKKAQLRYMVYKCGPNFACGANAKLPCGWGAVKVMKALARVEQSARTTVVENAISMGLEFLLGVDPASAAYPTVENHAPNQSWWKFGFPVFYVTDVLQIAEVMAVIGLHDDPRLNNLIQLILSKRDSDGRWTLEYNYDYKTWGKYGRMKQANKWVTLRAVRALQVLAPQEVTFQ